MNTAHSGENFPRILESMIGGAAFFAPPLEFLAGHHYR